MTYQVLARKWRPQDFDELIGQEAIVTALRNALRDDRIAHAYLFSGIRGVGKTTAARLLAKALNCERGPAEGPCNECTSCMEITKGSNLDVLEIDAATYSKVEQVRELTDSLRYAPARTRRKVVVLDEIHRLSRQAFDALLKIVEEPPEHLTFIFATTEIEAVPATILSRCQEFHFRRVPANVLVDYLRTMCESEKIEASDTALRLIARAGEGSVRDSVALLDQLATFGGGAVPEDDAARLLGGLDTALFERALKSVLEGNGPALSELVREIEDRGYDPRSAFAQFLDYLRDALHLAMGGKSAEGAANERVDLPSDERERLAKIAAAAGPENLLRILHLLLSSEPLVRRVEAPALALEVCWLRAAELPKLVALEQAIGSGSAGPSGIDVGGLGPASGSASGASSGSSAAEASAPEGQATEPTSPVSGAGTAAPSGPGATAAMSAAPASETAPPRDPPTSADKPAQSAPQSSSHGEPDPPESQPTLDPATLQRAAELPEVQTVLTVFGGTVESVESIEPAEPGEPLPGTESSADQQPSGLSAEDEADATVN